MTDDVKSTLYNAHTEWRSKYIYFLLAAVGGCIAFAVTQTQTAKLAWSQLPLAGAVLAWCVSFWCGCLHLQITNATQYDNMELLKVQSGEHPIIGRDLKAMFYATRLLRGGLQKGSNKAAFYFQWQFYMLVVGAALYIIWHILEMYIRSR